MYVSQIFLTFEFIRSNIVFDFIIQYSWKHSLLIQKYYQNCLSNNCSWNLSLLAFSPLIVPSWYLKFPFIIYHSSCKDSSLFDSKSCDKILILITFFAALFLMAIVSILYCWWDSCVCVGRCHTSSWNIYVYYLTLDLGPNTQQYKFKKWKCGNLIPLLSPYPRKDV